MLKTCSTLFGNGSRAICPTLNLAGQTCHPVLHCCLSWLHGKNRGFRYFLFVMQGVHWPTKVFRVGQHHDPRRWGLPLWRR